MQRGRTPTLQLAVCNLDMESIDRVDFMFKQTRSEDCETKVLKTYPGDDVFVDDKGVFNLQWTAEETRVFPPTKTSIWTCAPLIRMATSSKRSWLF